MTIAHRHHPAQESRQTPSRSKLAYESYVSDVNMLADLPHVTGLVSNPMRRTIFPLVAAVLLTPRVCEALMYCVSGNEPQAEANYTEWPGLVDVVNDPTRVQLCWCNGDETLWYQGDTEALNRVLKEFGEAELSEHNVVLLPGDGPLNKAKGTPSYDWMLHCVAGIAKARIERFHLAKVQDLHPTLTIYVTDRIDLDALRIPEGVTLRQVTDLRERYEAALDDGTEDEKKYAQQALERLDAQPGASREERRAYKARLFAIKLLVKRQQTQ
mgnify:FL=1